MPFDSAARPVEPSAAEQQAARMRDWIRISDTLGSIRSLKLAGQRPRGERTTPSMMEANADSRIRGFAIWEIISTQAEFVDVRMNRRVRGA